MTKVYDAVRSEIQAALRAKDDWLLVSFDYDRGSAISLSSDSQFAGFDKHRELRGPRWRPWDNAIGFRDIGYRWPVAGPVSMAVLANAILEQRRPTGAVMHCDAIDQWAPQLGRVQPTVNSTEGFVGPTSPAFKSLGAKRPGRVQRERLRKACHFCGATNELTLHHIVPREMGGATEPDNLVSVCRSCHDAIHDGRLDDSALVYQVQIKRVNKLMKGVRKRRPLV